MASRSFVAAGVALIAAGCARAPLVLPVRIEPEALTAPIRTGALSGYESAVRTIAAVMVGELGLERGGPRRCRRGSRVADEVTSWGSRRNPLASREAQGL